MGHPLKCVVMSKILGWDSPAIVKYWDSRITKLVQIKIWYRSLKPWQIKLTQVLNMFIKELFNFQGNFLGERIIVPICPQLSNLKKTYLSDPWWPSAMNISCQCLKCQCLICLLQHFKHRRYSNGLGMGRSNIGVFKHQTLE